MQDYLPLSGLKTPNRPRKLQAVQLPPGRRTTILDHDLRALLDFLCVEWGLCIPSSDANRITQSEEITGDELTKAVLKAERMDSKSDRHWFQKIKDRFVDQFESYDQRAQFKIRGLDSDWRKVRASKLLVECPSGLKSTHYTHSDARVTYGFHGLID